MMAKDSIIPKIVFIVPYRDRSNNLNVFRVMMTHLLEDYDPSSYEIFFAHQDDVRPFNRGGIKNVGFMAVRDKYPNAYRDITFVFNDVDTVPSVKGLINYETTRGVIKHFYGVQFALGGIFSITGHDFELINGFPCYWSWGYEDNVLNNRALSKGLTIDRSTLFRIGDTAILQTVDSYVKAINRRHKEMMRNDDGSDGISSITDVQYKFDDTSTSLIGSFIHITSFHPIHMIEHERVASYDLMRNKYVRCLGLPSLSKNPQNQIQENKSEQKSEINRHQQRNRQVNIPVGGRSRGLVMVGR
jgi:hypothetical protein